MIADVDPPDEFTAELPDNPALALLDFDNFQHEQAGLAPVPINRWKRIEEMVEAERDELALFLLTPNQDLEEQVKYIDYLLWRYLAYEAKLEQFIEEEEAKAKKFVDKFVVQKQNETDPGTNKFYTNAFATRLADVEAVPLHHRANALSASRKLRLVKGYIRALESKGRKLPGAQGTFNKRLLLEMDT